MLTIYFDANGVNKQVIKPSTAFFLTDKGFPKNYTDLQKDANAIAHDLSRGTYHKVTIEFN